MPLSKSTPEPGRGPSRLAPGIAALWAALRLDTLWSTLVASLIMGVAVSGMHYTGMAALRVQAVPGLTVSTAATASAGAFLLPLILGLCSIGFIFSAVIAVSPTAAEIFEEGELMRRIGQSQTAQSQTAQSQAAQSQATRYEPQVWQPRRSGQAQPGQAQPGQAQPRRDEPGSLFRPHRPKIQP